MIKATATALIVGSLTLAAATQAEEILNFLAPQAATVTTDSNLRTVFSEARRTSLLEDLSLEEALNATVQGLDTPGLRYRVDGTSIIAETDWSCRRAVVEDVWVRISDC